MTDKATVRVAVQLDEEEAKKLLANMQQLEQEVTKFDKPATQGGATQQERFWAETQKQVEIADEKLNQLLMTARAAGKEQQFLATLITKGEQAATNELNKMLGVKQKDNELTKEQIRLMQARATELRHESIAIRRAAMDLRLFSETAIITGTAVITGMTLMANKYADANKEGDAQAAKYTAQMDRVKASQNEIGKQFSIALMPFLEEAIKVMDKASKFLKENPEMAQAAIKGAEILIGVGMIGRSIAIAARLTADFLAIQSSIMRIIIARSVEAANAEKQVDAAAVQKLAADEQMGAAEMQMKGVVPKAAPTAAGTTGILGAISSPLGSIALVAANIALAKKISDQSDQLREMLNKIHSGLGDGFKLMVTSFFQAIPGGQFVGMVEQIKYISKAVQGILGKVENAVNVNGRTATTPAGRTDITAIPVGSVAMSKKFDDMLAAYEKYMDDDLALVQEHYAKRQDIIAKALEAIEKENARYADNIRKINESLAKQLEGYTKDFNRQAAKDERNWQEKRAEILRSSSDEILRIEQDLQDKLIKLGKDHAERQGDLLAARDALGLVKEQRRYQREQDEAIADANKEIARRRKDIAQRLADADREYQEQRAQRLADYQERVLEARQEAADKIKAEQERHVEEMKQIAKEEAEKLAEEQKHFNAERKKNYDQFIARLRDLDAFYLGETQRQRAHQQQMLNDLDAFLLAYRTRTQATFAAITAATKATTTTTGTTGHRAGGGYVGAQTYSVGEKGYEFVMDHPTTQAAEQIVGGRLNQQNVIGAMGKKTTIVWNDQRRFDGRITPAERRAITQDTIATIERMIE